MEVLLFGGVLCVEPRVCQHLKSHPHLLGVCHSTAATRLNDPCSSTVGLTFRRITGWTSDAVGSRCLWQCECDERVDSSRELNSSSRQVETLHCEAIQDSELCGGHRDKSGSEGDSQLTAGLEPYGTAAAESKQVTDPTATGLLYNKPDKIFRKLLCVQGVALRGQKESMDGLESANLLRTHSVESVEDCYAMQIKASTLDDQLESSTNARGQALRAQVLTNTVSSGESDEQASNQADVAGIIRCDEEIASITADKPSQDAQMLAQTRGADITDATYRTGQLSSDRELVPAVLIAGEDTSKKVPSSVLGNTNLINTAASTLDLLLPGF